MCCYTVRAKFAGATENQANERNPRKHAKSTTVPVVAEGSLENVSVSTWSIWPSAERSRSHDFQHD